MLISTVDCLEKKFSSFLSSSTAGVPSTHTGVGTVADRDSHQNTSYATVASSVPSSPSVGASDSTSLSSHKNVPIRGSQQSTSMPNPACP